MSAKPAELEGALARATLQSLGDAILSTDTAGAVTYLNPVAEQLTGWDSSQAAGHPVGEVLRIVDAVTREPAPNPLLRAVQENRAVSLDGHCVLVGRDGSERAIEDSASPIQDASGQVTGAVIVFRDVTTLRSGVRRMAHLARHDFLTGLPNRVLLRDRIDSALALTQRHGRRGALLFLDLDGFKAVNDAHGHAAGDRLLQRVAQRLVASVRASDTVSREGGDEFVVLLSEIGQAEDAALAARKIHAALAAPHPCGDRSLHLTASIGISIFPDDGQDADTLLHCADRAMYGVKHDTCSSYRFYQAASGTAGAG